MNQEFDFSKHFSPKRKKEFAQILLALQAQIGFKVSSRGWAYILEGKRYINKDQFDRVQDAINDLRRSGELPVDFIQEDGARDFEYIHNPYEPSMPELISKHIERVVDGWNWYNPDHWRDTDTYIQVIVEKVDLIALFEPLCKELSIPIANARGWSSIHQRAAYARRFKEAEADGKTCVLLYCGDHDPDGLRISETLRTNLEQVQNISWMDGEEGYNPKNLIIERFGLNFDFIQKHNLTWIDNLITGNTSKRMSLADKSHPNHHLPYVQNYLKTVGARKCEANALIVVPDAGRQLFQDAVSKYLNIDELRAHRNLMRLEAKQEYMRHLDTLEIQVKDIVDCTVREDDFEIMDCKIKVRAFINEAIDQLT